MSYHRLGSMPAFTSTQAFAEAVDPYSGRFSPRGEIYSPYGWGPDFNVGMPMNYTHHIGYERTPIPGARRVGPMYDVLEGLGCGDEGPAGNGHWHYSVGGAMPRCTFKTRDEAARLAFKDLTNPYGRGAQYAELTFKGVPKFVVMRSGAIVPVGLGDPYAPSYKQVPMTWRGDVRYVLGNYESGIFDGRGEVDGNAQQLAGLGGILAVM